MLGPSLFYLKPGHQGYQPSVLSTLDEPCLLRCYSSNVCNIDHGVRDYGRVPIYEDWRGYDSLWYRDFCCSNTRGFYSRSAGCTGSTIGGIAIEAIAIGLFGVATAGKLVLLRLPVLVTPCSTLQTMQFYIRVEERMGRAFSIHSATDTWVLFLRRFS